MTTVENATGAIDLAPVSARRTPTGAVRTLSRKAASPRIQPALMRRRAWERAYARRLWLTDATLVVLVTAGAQAATAAAAGASFLSDIDAARGAAVSAVLWLLALWGLRSRDGEFIGAGVSEYKRVAHATGLSFGVLACVFAVFEWDGIRTQLLIALPVGLFALLLERWTWRRWLMAERRHDRFTAQAIVAGSREEVTRIIESVAESVSRPFTVLGIATSDGRAPLVVNGITYPVLGDVYSAADQAREHGADSVIVASAAAGDPEYIKQLSWQLEGTASELILSSRLTDVAGPRISLRPIDDLPLISVKIPEFQGTQHAIKRALDIAMATLALVPTSLVGLAIALLIKLDDGGPVFFRQTRVGRDGREFKILKFRTMRIDAEEQLAALRAENEGAGPLFKLKSDPRITRVGNILRKLSLDELPQFWNVLRGDMSIVGPRPPLPSEVMEYEDIVYRRLFIKPGITGLWQVSGRSDLTWEQSVRLDLRYVENWSVMMDLMIMWRTAKVMVRPSGAY